MKTEDVTERLKLALQASGFDRAKVMHKPRLLSDNGSSYISGDLAEWLEEYKMDHLRGAPYHPQTQGKIERWHQTLKKTESYWRTIICRVIWENRSASSSITTTTVATTRA